MALRPIVLHAWAERRLAIELADLLGELGGLTLEDVSWSSPGITVAPAGFADTLARVDVLDLVAGLHEVTARCLLSNGDTIDRSLTLDVRDQVFDSEVDRRGRIVPVWVDPDADAALGLDWAAVLAEIGVHAPGTVIASSEWPDVAGFAFSDASQADGVTRVRVDTSLAVGASAVIENRVTFGNGERDARNILVKVGSL